MGMVYLTKEVAVTWTSTSEPTCRLGHTAAFETLQVPVAVNTKTVDAGTELVLMWAHGPKAAPKPAATKRGKTWAADQRAHNRRRVKAAEVLTSAPDQVK